MKSELCFGEFSFEIFYTLNSVFLLLKPSKESEWFWSSRAGEFNLPMRIEDFRDTMAKEYCRFDNLNLDIYQEFIDAGTMQLKDDGTNLLWKQPLPSNKGPKCGWEQNGKNIWQKIKQTITYSGPGLDKDDFGNELGPILTLEERDTDGKKDLGLISTWQPGDQIVVASTSWDARESEVFELVECKLGNGDPCASNQVRINRPPRFTHWGKRDSRTGIDQRAEVGLLSRNVRFYGEMDEIGTCVATGEKCDETCPGKCKKCRYAYTREQLTKAAFTTNNLGQTVQIHPGSPNHIQTGTYEDPDGPVNPHCRSNDHCNCAGIYADDKDCVKRIGAFEKEDSEDKGFQRGCAYYEYINGEDKVLFKFLYKYTSSIYFRIYMVPIWFLRKISKTFISVTWKYLMLVSLDWHDIQYIGITLIMLARQLIDTKIQALLLD